MQLSAPWTALESHGHSPNVRLEWRFDQGGEATCMLACLVHGSRRVM